MALDPATVRGSYDRIAGQYAEEFDDELSHRPLERALLGALPELAGLDASPGVVADLGAGPSAARRCPRSRSTCRRPWRPWPTTATTSPPPPAP
jgi:hypothetical protein